MDILTFIENQAGDGHSLAFHIFLTFISFLAYKGYKLMKEERLYDKNQDGLLDTEEFKYYWRKNIIKTVVSFLFTVLFFLIPNQALKFVAPNMGDNLTLDISYVAAGFAGVLIRIWLDKRNASS